MKYTPYIFDVDKAAQAAAALLRREQAGLMTRIRLMKLLYIANRRMLRKHGRPLLRARAVAMKNGPVLSEVYHFVSEQSDARWSNFIQNDGPWIVRLVKDPGDSELSQAEAEVLDEVTDELARCEDWEIVRLTHDFAEWSKNYPDRERNTSHTIPVADILEAIQVGESAPDILQDIADEEEFDRLFAS
jgi:uncharacterized phage-associated protein